MGTLFRVTGLDGVDIFVVKANVKYIKNYSTDTEVFTKITFLGGEDDLIVNEDVETVINRFEYP